MEKDLIEIEFVDAGGLSEYSIINASNYNKKILNIFSSIIPRVVVGAKSDLENERKVALFEG